MLDRNLTDLIPQFRDYLNEAKFLPSSQRAYLQIGTHFLSFATRNGNKQLGEIDLTKNYLAKYGSNSRNVRAACLRVLFDFLRQRGLLDCDPLPRRPRGRFAAPLKPTKDIWIPESLPMKATLEEVLDAYCHHLGEERFRSYHTIRNYCGDTQYFFRFLRTQGIKNKKGLFRVDRNLVRAHLTELCPPHNQQVHDGDYQEHGRRRQAKAGTLQRKIYALRSFFKWLVYDQGLKRNPIEDMRGPRILQREVSWLSERETNRLLKVDMTVRDRAIIETLYSTGIRAAEVCGLTWGNINWESGVIRVVGKGDKERIVPIGRVAMQALNSYRAWIGKKDKALIQVTRRVFLSGTRGPKREGISTRSLQRIVARYVSKVRLPEKKVGPHTLRHTFATHLLNRGAGIREIQEMLGHASISTTAKYTHLDLANMRRIYRKAFPRA